LFRYPPLAPFRDAAFGVCTWDMTVLDCCRAVARATAEGWFDYETFDVDEYDFYRCSGQKNPGSARLFFSQLDLLSSSSSSSLRFLHIKTLARMRGKMRGNWS
jgi:hypothetical protein